jgi:predicted nucleotidyltransferase
MDLSAPFEGMFPTVDSAVLEVLTAAAKPRTGREVARLAKRSQAATQRVLDRLVEHGLVLRQEAGRARVYTLNLNHVAAEPVLKLATLRAALFTPIDEKLDQWRPQPLHASVFGSAARGDGGPNSDVDIFLVRPRSVDEDDIDWRSSVEDLAKAVFEWTGNHAGIAEVSEEELKRLRREQPEIVHRLRADAVELAGIPIHTLLRGQ